MIQTHSRAALFAAVALLLLYTATRLHHVLSFPAFMDEPLVIEWAQRPLQVTAGYFGASGRVLPSYWIALFNPYQDSLWIARSAHVLLSVIGAASVYGLGRRLGGNSVARLALVILTFAPFAFFFDRMLIPDAVGAGFAALVLLLALRVQPHARLQDGIMLGIALTLVILSRVTLIILLAAPLWAVLLLCRSRKGLRWMVASYTTCVVTLVPLLLLYAWRGQNYFFGFGNKGGDTSDLVVRFTNNVTLLADAFGTYLHPLFAVLLIVGVVWAAWRSQQARFLLLCALPILAGLVLFGRVVTVRYFVPALPVLIVLFAWAILRLRPVWSLGVVGVWVCLFAIPWMFTAYTAPQHLTLARDDQFEYINGLSAGFGLPDAATELTRYAPVTVIGWHANCPAMKLYVAPDLTPGVTLECPIILWTGESAEPFSDDLQNRLANGESVLVISEDLPFLPDSYLPDSRTALATFTRPQGGNTMTLWKFD
jgi:4-amino-4-deoxy-L-arabinose transferase-like glycosyltransferase